jgi:hypothetical protein
MQIIGFNLTKISVEKNPEFKRVPINTSIEFTSIEKDHLEILKDKEALKLLFKFGIIHGESKENNPPAGDEILGNVNFEGAIILATEKDEAKEIQKSWKKKKLGSAFQVPIYNFILRKCSPKAVALSDDIGLPPHMPIPQIKPQQDQQ